MFSLCTFFYRAGESQEELRRMQNTMATEQTSAADALLERDHLKEQLSQLQHQLHAKELQWNKEAKVRHFSPAMIPSCCVAHHGIVRVQCLSIRSPINL